VKFGGKQIRAKKFYSEKVRRRKTKAKETQTGEFNQQVSTKGCSRWIQVSPVAAP
jgi:hypothetical protein